MKSYEDTFENATSDYEDSRPEYPTQLYNDIFSCVNINSNSNVLEIGMGTGKATLPILEKGCHLTGIEPGKQLIKLAKKKYAENPHFSAYNGTLENYEGVIESFDLIFSATAFHWIPEEYGYKKVYELLKKGGVFARFAYHAGYDKKRMDLSRKIQQLYKLYMHSDGERKEYSEDEAARLCNIAKNYGFTDTSYKLYHMAKNFSADEYMKLLKTYPDHIRLEKSDKEKLFDGIYSAINEYSGIVTIDYTVDLQIAVKK